MTSINYEIPEYTLRSLNVHSKLGNTLMQVLQMFAHFQPTTRLVSHQNMLNAQDGSFGHVISLRGEPKISRKFHN